MVRSVIVRSVMVRSVVMPSRRYAFAKSLTRIALVTYTGGFDFSEITEV